MAKLEKKEGAEGNCPSCGDKIFCRLKQSSGNFPAKLQWQNEDYSAHYNYDFSKPENERISCNRIPAGTVTTEPPSEAGESSEPKSELSRIQKKFYDVDELSELLYKASKTQLQKIMGEFDIPKLDKDQFSIALIFIESWSRTLSQTLR